MPLEGPSHELSGQTDDKEEGVEAHLPWVTCSANLTLPTLEWSI